MTTQPASLWVMSHAFLVYSRRPCQITCVHCFDTPPLGDHSFPPKYSVMSHLSKEAKPGRVCSLMMEHFSKKYHVANPMVAMGLFFTWFSLHGVDDTNGVVPCLLSDPAIQTLCTMVSCKYVIYMRHLSTMYLIKPSPPRVNHNCLVPIWTK